MTRRVYWLAVTFSALVSFSYLLWGWNDTTLSNWSNLIAVREQTRADHIAAIGFAMARVVLTLFLLELGYK